MPPPFRSSLQLGSLLGITGVFVLLGTPICSASPAAAIDPGAVRPAASAETGAAAEPETSFNSLPNAPIPNAVLMAGGASHASGDEARKDLGAESPAHALTFLRTGDSVVRPSSAEGELGREQLTEGCESGRIKGKACKVRWLPILWQSFEWLTAQHAGNILLDSETRNDLTSNPYWSTYVYCVEHYRWYQWSDDTTFIVHNIGHPMMGGITSSIFEQNDPKARALVFENNSNYWRSRLKAMAWSAVYSAQWKVGPVSEASIGNSGRNTYYVAHLGRTTNETGFQDFVITPVYGFGWNVGEDAIDRYLMPKIHAHVKNRFYLTALSVMTPCKGAANLLRWKPTYYRDTAYAPPGSN
ncbi:hypothetical protein [Tunturibacter empetritectus]|uniref:Uncharacterized protein n=1 Tax=Tunturiibacter lichenicola TaxID=2051959 RepID=A0A7W8J8K5_9BACT|nr:hypothetical protein [Edaphobacter lichenicola]MBB5343521.1 hypothetical protein [Edaphobacter lichenicola]